MTEPTRAPNDPAPERVEVDGSTDAFGWFTDAEAAGLPLVELVELVLELEREER